MEHVRYNAFNQVHKGLRALLYDTSLLLQRADYSQDGEVAEVVARMKEVIFLFEEHAHTEDTKVFPLLNTIAPELAADFEAQHVRDHELGEALAAALRMLETVETPIGRQVAGAGLQTAFRDFTAFNLTHMNGEESLINEKLWQHYSDEALLGLTRSIVAAIPPETNMRFSYWMLKGLSMPETLYWYNEMKAGAPAFVFEAMVGLAEKALPAARFTILQQALDLQLVA